MERDQPCHAMHREIAENVTALRAGSLDAPALKRDLRKFFCVKKFRAAQMIVALLYARVDAAHLDLCCDRRILRMLAIDINLAPKFRELSVRGAEELMHAETNR